MDPRNSTDPRKLNQIAVEKGRRKPRVIKFTLPYLQKASNWIALGVNGSEAST